MVEHQQFYQSLSICGEYFLIDPELTHDRQLEVQEEDAIQPIELLESLCVVEREQLPSVLHATAILIEVHNGLGWLAENRGEHDQISPVQGLVLSNYQGCFYGKVVPVP